jgi:hypothetical protein
MAKKKMVKCPDCGGSGRKQGGVSEAIKEAVRHGYNNSYECECCLGSGKVPEGTDPDWWKVSDNATGGR